MAAAGTVIAPLFSRTTARVLAGAGLLVGVAGGLGIVLLARDLGAERGAAAASVIAFTVAGVAGVLLVSTGLGLLAGEAVTTIAIEQQDAHNLLDVTASNTTAIPPEAFEVLNKALSGLTSARAAIFAGVFLLAIATASAGLGAAGEDDGTGGSEPSATCSASEPPSCQPRT